MFFLSTCYPLIISQSWQLQLIFEVLLVVCVRACTEATVAQRKKKALSSRTGFVCSSFFAPLWPRWKMWDFCSHVRPLCTLVVVASSFSSPLHLVRFLSFPHPPFYPPLLLFSARQFWTFSAGFSFDLCTTHTLPQPPSGTSSSFPLLFSPLHTHIRRGSSSISSEVLVFAARTESIIQNFRQKLVRFKGPATSQRFRRNAVSSSCRQNPKKAFFLFPSPKNNIAFLHRLYRCAPRR